jgi:hypothetical protein
MDALRSRLRLAPGKKNIGGTSLEGKVRIWIKCCFINELPFASKDTGQPSLQETSGALVPLILVATPDLTAKRPDASAKFPVISAANLRCKSLILRIQLAYFGGFQAQKPQKYPVIETRSRQTASTTISLLPDVQTCSLPFALGRLAAALALAGLARAGDAHAKPAPSQEPEVIGTEIGNREVA